MGRRSWLGKETGWVWKSEGPKEKGPDTFKELEDLGDQGTVQGVEGHVTREVLVWARQAVPGKRCCKDFGY